MKSEALECLESHLALGHINIPEFSALHDLLDIFNRLLDLTKRMYAGDIDWQTGIKSFAEEAAGARKHLHAFQQLYTHTLNDLQRYASDRGDELDTANRSNVYWAETIGNQFKDDFVRLPGTLQLFELISEQFDNTVYHPFMQTHRRHPNHRIWELEPELSSVYISLTHLYDLISEIIHYSNKLSEMIAEYHRLCAERGEGSAVKTPEKVTQWTYDSSGYVLSMCKKSPAAANDGIIREELPTHPYGPSRSFSAVEEAVARRPSYTVQGTGEASDGESRPKNMPRVFTGSFKELEEEMRKLRIPDANADTSPTTQVALRDPNTMAESVTTPVSCARPSSVGSSPGLRRREALLERDVELKDRVIHGDVIRSRRPVECEPSDAARVQDKEETVSKRESLTQWLNDAPRKERKVSPAELRTDNAV